MPIITINGENQTQAGKDVAIRRKPISGLKVQGVVLENFLVDGWATGKAVHISATETVSDRHYESIFVQNGVILNTKFLPGSHCDGIKIDFGNSVPVRIVLENILIRGGEGGVMPIHIADGTVPGYVTLRNVQVENYPHPVHVGRSDLATVFLRVENSPGIHIVGKAKEVSVANSPGAVVYGETYGPATPPPEPPPPQESIEQLKQDILNAQNEINRLILERNNALKDAKRHADELIQIDAWVAGLTTQLEQSYQALLSTLNSRP